MSDRVNENDVAIATAVSECRRVMEELSTTDSLTASCNLLNGYFRLCCVCGEREILEEMANDVCNGLLDEIESVGNE